MTNLFDKPVIDRPDALGRGFQKIYRFRNGYGASVVRNKIEFGDTSYYASYTDNEDEFELAVIRFSDEDNTHYHITIDTPITDDVIGHLTEAEVEEVLQAIAKLKPWKETK